VPQVIIVGALHAAQTVALHRVFIECFLPGAVSLVVEPGAHQAALVERLPWLTAMEPVDGRPTAFVCHDFECQAPTIDPEVFRAQLEALSAR